MDCGNSTQVQVSCSIDVYAINKESGSFFRGALAEKTTKTDFPVRIPANLLSYGLYYFKVTGSIETVAGTTVDSLGYIEVTSTTLFVNITGKSRASQGFNKILTLNGSQSYDPDVGRGNYTGLNFMWLCRRVEETFSDNITSLPVVLPLSGFSGSSDLGGCYGTGIGKLRPRTEEPYILDLDVDKMKGDQDYVVKLILAKNGQKADTVHQLRIKKEIQLSIM